VTTTLAIERSAIPAAATGSVAQLTQALGVDAATLLALLCTSAAGHTSLTTPADTT
jgi:hypothetical protein